MPVTSDLQFDLLSRIADGGWPCISVDRLRKGDPKTAADSASFSRAVRRLARRGLVLPIVYHPAGKGDRANGLVICDRGLALLEGLR